MFDLLTSGRSPPLPTQPDAKIVSIRKRKQDNASNLFSNILTEDSLDIKMSTVRRRLRKGTGHY